jgi:hypothetical protein
VSWGDERAENRQSVRIGDEFRHYLNNKKDFQRCCHSLLLLFISSVFLSKQIATLGVEKDIFVSLLAANNILRGMLGLGWKYVPCWWLAGFAKEFKLQWIGDKRELKMKWLWGSMFADYHSVEQTWIEEQLQSECHWGNVNQRIPPTDTLTQSKFPIEWVGASYNKFVATRHSMKTLIFCLTQRMTSTLKQLCSSWCSNVMN